MPLLRTGVHVLLRDGGRRVPHEPSDYINGRPGTCESRGVGVARGVDLDPLG